MWTRHQTRGMLAAVLLAVFQGGSVGAPVIGFGATNLLAQFIPAATNLNLGGETGFRSEFSGACVHPLTGEVLVVLRSNPFNGDHAIQFYTPAGTYTRHVRLTGFSDLEGICLVDPASNRVAVVEEALNAITILNVASNTTTLAKDSGRTLEMGLGPLANAGIEGIVWDAARSCFYAVKEYQPLAIYRVIDQGTNAVTEVLFDAPAKLGALCVDLSDIDYDPVSDRLLILSHESHLVVESDLDGTVIDTQPVGLNQPEGLALAAGRDELYAIGEPNHFLRWRLGHVYTVTEGSSLNLPLMVSETPEPETPAAVDVQVAGLDAVPGIDFLTTSNVLLSAAATGTLAVVALEDLDLEAPEAFYLMLTNAVNATLSEDPLALIWLLDPGGFTGTVTTAGIGIPFRASMSAVSTNGTLLSAFAGSASLEGWGAVWRSANLLAPTATANQQVGQTTRGLRFTPTRNLTITHFRHFSGDTVSLWTDDNQLLASASGSVNLGVWQTLPLSPPLLVASGQTYRVASVRRDGVTLHRHYSGGRALPMAAADVVINSGCYIDGDAFPSIVTNREYVVDLMCLKELPATFAVTPSAIGPFDAGRWEGWLIVTEAVHNAQLVIRDSFDHLGRSATFSVAEFPPVLVSLPPLVREEDGLLVGQGQVTLTTNDWDQPREVLLFAEPDDRLVVPASVLVPAFQTNATFDLDLQDNTHREGAPRPVTVYATHPGHATGTNTLTVIDDDAQRGLLLHISMATP